MGGLIAGVAECCLGWPENGHPVGNTQEATGHVVWAPGWAVGVVVDGWYLKGKERSGSRVR